MTEQTPLPTPVGSGRRYELHERLGAGAFGEVYLATVNSTAGFSRKVALKLLHPTRFGDDDATRRIRDEARVLGRLHHPNIVTVFDLVRLERQWAVVMEYVEGADLERLLQALAKKGERFPPAAVLELVALIADALDAAYNAEGDEGRPLRVVHRDVKPANIRLTPNGEAKILDFGIARARHSREASTGSYVIGTQRYMAPERIAGRDDGPASDVYSLAATAAELLTGTPVGRSPVLAARHERFIVAKLRTLSKHVDAAPDVIGRVAGLMHQCLSHEPLDRPSAADLSARALELADQLGGQRLRSFGRRFVPQVDPLLGRRPDVVSGVLTERTGSHAAMHGEPETLRTASTDAARTDASEAPAIDSPADAPEVRRGWVLPMLGAAGGVVLVGAVVGLVMAAVVGIGVYLLVRAESPPTPAVSPLSPPAPDAPVAPAPPPDPPSDAGTSPESVPAPAPAPKAAPRPAPRTPAIAPAPPPESDTDAPKILSRAQVVLDGADSLLVRCGDRSAEGSTSARIMRFPAGPCTVRASRDGRTVEGVATILAPRTVRCRIDGEALSCD